MKKNRFTPFLYTPTYILALWLAVLLFFSQCQPVKPLKATLHRKMPAAFRNQPDAENSAMLSWREYFVDSTLRSLIDTALRNNLDLAIALQRTEQAQSQVIATKGLPLPYVNAVAGAGVKKFGRYTADAVGNYDVQFSPNITREEVVPQVLPDLTVGLQASWEVDIWKKLKNTKKAALSRYLATVEARKYIMTSVIANVAEMYYDLLTLDNELTTIRQTIALQEKSLAIIEIQKSAGTSNELAVKQFEAQVLNFKSLEIGIRQRILEIENRLNFLLGRFPQPISRNTSLFQQLIPKVIHAGVPTDLLANRPDVREAEYELLAANADVQAARAAFYPSLNITATAGLQSFNPQFLLSPESIGYNLLGGLSAPLLNRSMIKAKFSYAKSVEIEALLNYQQKVLRGYKEVYSQFIKLSNLEEMYALKNQEVITLAQSTDISQTLFSTGRASYLEVILTQKNSLQTRLELADLKKEQFNAVIDIYKALGGGWR